jgi:ADP-ribosylglycohydrolase
MLGAISGDVIGSVFEHRNIKTTEFPLFSAGSRFTDDTVLTVAVGHAILDGLDYAETIKSYAQRYPRAGYGGAFRGWVYSPTSEPYNSWGNGSAMRVSPVGWAFDSVEEVISHAEKTAKVTHNHPEGTKGAQAVALAVYLARTGEKKETIKQEISTRFGYDLDRTLDEIRPVYSFDVSCRGSVPEAIIAFLESNGFESAIRNAISIGGDSDTIACIAGGIAEAFYDGVPAYIKEEVQGRLDPTFIEIVDRFSLAFERRVIS